MDLQDSFQITSKTRQKRCPRFFQNTSKTRQKGFPRFFQSTSKTKHKGSLRFFKITSKTGQEFHKVSFTLLQKPDTRNSRDGSFETYIKNKPKEVPEILSNYFKNWIRDLQDSFQTTSKTRQKRCPRFFQSTSKTKQKGPWDSSKLLQKQDMKSTKFLLNYFKNQTQDILEMDSFKLTSKTNQKKSPRFFQITSKTG